MNCEILNVNKYTKYWC